MATQHVSFAASAQELLPPRRGGLDASRLPSFEFIAGHYGPQLYRTALRHLRNPDDAQDAVQEALLAAYRHLDQFQGRAEISTWLTRIVINAARSQRRRASARPAASLEECALAGRQFRDARPDPEVGYAQIERRARLRRLIQRLSPPLRAAIQLYVIEGLPLRQAAVRLGVKPATLKCRVFRARTRLGELAASGARLFADLAPTPPLPLC